MNVKAPCDHIWHSCYFQYICFIVARGAFNLMLKAEMNTREPDTDNTGVGMHWLLNVCGCTAV